MSHIADEYKKNIITFTESYAKGKWDVKDLEDFLFQMMRDKTLRRMWMARYETNEDSMDAHYNLGNDLFEAMLGHSMCYSAARWQFANDLDMAQTHKLKVLVEKLELRPGMSVLDIGCGWGTFAKYCQEADVKVYVDQITLSKEQAKVAKHYSPVRICDYRKATGSYDRVISIGMLEHVGHENYKDYFRTVDRCLKPDGIHIFEFSANNVRHKVFNSWIKKHIFPDGYLPSLAEVLEASERLFIIEDVENFGLDYIKTCRAWWENCENSTLYQASSK